MSAAPRIPYNRPCLLGTELAYVQEAMHSGHQSGNGPFSKRCERLLEQRIGCRRAMLTPSCTHALELAALLLDLGPGDEVIMPSFTFVSTANAFALRGATVVFVDNLPDTLNIDPDQVADAITDRTRAIVPVHYAGVPCDMDALSAIAAPRNITIVEDAAQALGSAYRGKPAGSLGHMAAVSFHETKNVTSGGEGGALLINDPTLVERAEIVREKGTNRSAFFRGQVDKYTWVDIGSSLLPSELQAAYLCAQLESIDSINDNRLRTWTRYDTYLREYSSPLRGPTIPKDTQHNGHIFHLRADSLAHRSALLRHLNDHGIHAVFHYVPLHSAPGANGRSRFHGIDRHTTLQSELLLRLPLWYGMPDELIDHVCTSVRAAWNYVSTTAGGRLTGTW